MLFALKMNRTFISDFVLEMMNGLFWSSVFFLFWAFDVQRNCALALKRCFIAHNQTNKKMVEGENFLQMREISIEVSKEHKFLLKRFVERQHLGMSPNLIRIYIFKWGKIKCLQLSFTREIKWGCAEQAKTVKIWIGSIQPKMPVT